jgi:hypothetical protein
VVGNISISHGSDVSNKHIGHLFSLGVLPVKAKVGAVHSDGIRTNLRCKYAAPANCFHSDPKTTNPSKQFYKPKR